MEEVKSTDETDVNPLYATPEIQQKSKKQNNRQRPKIIEIASVIEEVSEEDKTPKNYKMSPRKEADPIQFLKQS